MTTGSTSLISCVFLVTRQESTNRKARKLEEKSSSKRAPPLTELMSASKRPASEAPDPFADASSPKNAKYQPNQEEKSSYHFTARQWSNDQGIGVGKAVVMGSWLGLRESCGAMTGRFSSTHTARLAFWRLRACSWATCTTWAGPES